MEQDAKLELAVELEVMDGGMADTKKQHLDSSGGTST